MSFLLPPTNGKAGPSPMLQLVKRTKTAWAQGICFVQMMRSGSDIKLLGAMYY